MHSLIRGLVLLLAIPHAFAGFAQTPEAKEPLVAGVPVDARTYLNFSDDVVLKSISFVRDNVMGNPGLSIVGEVTNVSDKRIVNPSLMLLFTDEFGSRYWEKTTYPVQNFLDAGESGVFWSQMIGSDIDLLDGSTIFEVRSCHTEFLGDNAADRESSELTIEGTPLVFNNGSFRGTVDLRNTGGTEVKQPWIYAITRNANGTVIEVSSNSFRGPLPPGAFSRDQVSLASSRPESAEIVAYDFGYLSIGCPSNQ